MIESISIAKVATFGVEPQVLTDLSTFNFIFGSNGTGKTSVSRVIADESQYPDCKVKWKSGTSLQAMVYNRDFVERNFTQAPELKGVFTLGEKQVDTLSKIATAKLELDAIATKIATLTQSLQGLDGSGGKKGQLATLEGGLKDKCWLQKQKHDSTLQAGFEGYRNNSEKFKGKVLAELTSNKATLLTLAELEKKALSIFGPTPTPEAIVPAVDASELLAHEANPILKKRVIGKDDVNIAAMIKKLGNSDWVREGREFFDLNEGTCPFCQQSTPEAFATSLEAYFDETFASETKAISELATNYDSEAARVQQQMAAIIGSPSRFLDIEKLKSERDLLDAKLTLNRQLLAEKKKEASQLVELKSLSNVLAAIAKLVDAANSEAVAHNKMVANLESERGKWTAQVWRFVLEELKADLAAFKADKDSLDKAIASLDQQIKTATAEKRLKVEEIAALEKQATSIQPTIDEINELLSSFGFHGFKLGKAAAGSSYKLVRSDGTDAKSTLSEGEKTFVTFLYFYQLLKGSESESGMTTDRIVVFDDPVSSLDSDILFIVGSLIKGLFDEVRAGTGHIKQIFVLTHNVYFHKEVAYNSRRQDVAMKEETFWIVRKPGLVSKIERYLTNPVKTSYELLWAEVRKPDKSNLSIQNTLRRILENYFRILGGIELSQLCALFEGKEKIICQSLCSWVHDGSHYAHDSLYVSIDDSMVDSYLRVFRAIFKESRHLEHYKMMMGDAFEEEPVVVAAQSGSTSQTSSPSA